LSLWQDKTFFDWAASQGLDRKKVEDMYNSFGIGGKVNRARLAAQTYQVQSVPLVIVDGKFQTNRIGSHGAMPAAIDALVAKARAERPKG
jgi:thiol:disulfide interchange protein DsbA